MENNQMEPNQVETIQTEGKQAAAKSFTASKAFWPAMALTVALAGTAVWGISSGAFSG